MCLFSIIIPVYNVENYLQQCLNSVLYQDFSDFEVILVNDGSTDSSPAICDDYATQDRRVTVIHQTNGGLSDARNTGIKAATGSYLMFLDSDDYWNDNDFLNTVAGVIATTPALDILNFSWNKYFPSKDKLVPEKRNFSVYPLKKEKNRQYINRLIKKDLYIACAWNKCVQRTFVVDHQIYFKKGLRSEDMDWCGQLLFHMPQMTCLDKNSYVYRQQRAGSITANVDKKHLADIIQMIELAVENSKKLHSPERRNYLSFYAVQYLTLLFNLNILSIKDEEGLVKKVYDLRNILNYDYNYKVKIANAFTKLFGFNLMIKVLQSYVAFGQK